MSERDPLALPPDHDAPGQVDYPDPAFDDDHEDDVLDTPDADEPEALEE